MLDKQKNAVASPAAIRILLSILNKATSGLAQREIEETAYLKKQYEINTDTSQTIPILEDTIIDSPNIHLVNKIYTCNNSTINPNFIEIVSERQSYAETIDFTTSGSTVDSINAWIAIETNNVITNYLKLSYITPNLQAIAINTLYFNALWNNPFIKYDGLVKNFTTIDGVVMSIPFMERDGLYQVGRMDSTKATIIDIPFDYDSLCTFRIIMPDIDSNIDEVQSSLTPDAIINVKLTSKNYQLSIPILEFDTKLNVQLLLKQLGIQNIFSTPSLDIMEDSNPLLLDYILQNIKLKIDDLGTSGSTNAGMILFKQLQQNIDFF